MDFKAASAKYVTRVNRFEDAAVRNSACRALSVLTESHSELKLVLLKHAATHTVLIPQLSSFDDELKGAHIDFAS